MSEYCEAVLSQVVLRYQEANHCSFLEIWDTMENLYAKFQIIKGDDGLNHWEHLIGRKFKTQINNGRTIFMGYY